MINSTYRYNDIDRNLKLMTIRPLDVLVVGATGAGKSATLNAILGKSLSPVGTGCDPQTMNISSYSLSELFRLWDSPGLGDGHEQDIHHTHKLIDSLYDTYTVDDHRYGLIDLVLVVVEGCTRDLGTVFHLLNDIIVPNFQSDRILVAINQADVAMKGRHWDYELHRPDHVLKDFLEDKACSIKSRVYEATGVRIANPVYYSAEEGYHTHQLLDLIIDHMPRSRRELVIR